jgi:hypothetical protein
VEKPNCLLESRCADLLDWVASIPNMKFAGVLASISLKLFDMHETRRKNTLKPGSKTL